MGVCTGCGKIVLVLINLLFGCVGILLLVVGFIVKYGKDAMEDVLSEWYRRFREALEEAGASHVDLNDFNIEQILENVAIVFIVIGFFFLLMGILGCCGACLESRCCLIIYTIIIALIFLVELTCVILLFAMKDKVRDWLKEPMYDAIEDDYTGINGTDSITLGLNFVMSEFDCCGVENYTDFYKAKNWDRNLTNGQQKMIPVICCKNTTTAGLESSGCLTNPTSENSNIDKGCYDAIEEWVEDHQDVLIGTGSGVAALEILLIIFACVVCIKKKRDFKGYEKHV